MAVSLNGITIPTSIAQKGNYLYTRYVLAVDNGLGDTIVAGLPSVSWTFTSLQPSEYSWFTVTLLNRANSLRCAAVLWDDLDVETAYSQVVVRYPRAPEGRRNGRYRNVQILIDTMVEA